MESARADRAYFKAILTGHEASRGQRRTWPSRFDLGGTACCRATSSKIGDSEGYVQRQQLSLYEREPRMGKA
jgi:hypothetical protein